MVDILLIIILIVSLITDLHSRRILNLVTLPGIAFGMIFHIFIEGGEGILFSLLGFFTGMGLLIIPYILGGMGAGDVKLLGTIGALKGASFVFLAFLYSCVVGGIIAVIILSLKKELIQSFQRIRIAMYYRHAYFLNREELGFPYGVAIVMGTLYAIWGGRI